MKNESDSLFSQNFSYAIYTIYMCSSSSKSPLPTTFIYFQIPFHILCKPSFVLGDSNMSEPPKFAYPYPAQGYYQGPPVMAPPQYQYTTALPPKREPSFLEGCLAALCCCCLLDEFCCDPSIIFVG